MHKLALNERGYYYTLNGRFAKTGGRFCTHMLHEIRRIKNSGTRAAEARQLVLILDNATDNKNNEILQFFSEIVLRVSAALACSCDG